jgi:hypothetical protein
VLQRIRSIFPRIIRIIHRAPPPHPKIRLLFFEIDKSLFANVPYVSFDVIYYMRLTLVLSLSFLFSLTLQVANKEVLLVQRHGDSCISHSIGFLDWCVSPF